MFEGEIFNVDSVHNPTPALAKFCSLFMKNSHSVSGETAAGFTGRSRKIQTLCLSP